MLMTERKALTIMFEETMDEKRALKRNYREDLQALESRQQLILDRLQRLDDFEREAVDVEGVLTKLNDSAKEIAALLPDVPAVDVVERAAQKMAEMAIENDSVITGSVSQEERKKKEMDDLIRKETMSAPGHRPQSKHVPEILDEIEKIMLDYDRPMQVREIERELKERLGWEWKKFTGTFSLWRSKYPNRLIKRGRTYFINNGTKEGNQYGQGNQEPEEATIQEFEADGGH